jgi:anaerobic selenocysteine-containing dehydrogenase
MQVSRRQFFKICAGGMAGTTAAALGLPQAPRSRKPGNINCCVPVKPVTPVRTVLSVVGC